VANQRLDQSCSRRGSRRLAFAATSKCSWGLSLSTNPKAGWGLAPSPRWGEGWGEGLRRLALTLFLIAPAAHADGPPTSQPASLPAELRVCADPDNLPFSHENGTGFENRIAQLVADELHLPLKNFWLPLRRGFVRKSLGANECDVFIGVPAQFERVLPTKPYYRSSYVFVTRADDPKPLASFDDARIAKLHVGVQLVGNDLAATPPGHALVQRGAIDNVTGFTVFGDGPAAQRMVDSLVQGRIDAALIWGPQAGYFAQQAARPMHVRIATPPPSLTMPFEFAISMGVRRGDKALRDALDGVIDKRRADIDAILASYQVPRTDAGASR
jgi:mxaJ protein